MESGFSVNFLLKVNSNSNPLAHDKSPLTRKRAQIFLWPSESEEKILLLFYDSQTCNSNIINTENYDKATQLLT